MSLSQSVGGAININPNDLVSVTSSSSWRSEEGFNFYHKNDD